MSRSRERGMTMVVGLIMLALLTLMAISSFTIGRTSLEIVGNMQQRSEATSAAKDVIEEVKSTERMFKTPNNVIHHPGGDLCTAPNTKCFDLNDDDVADITVTLTPAPTCVQAPTLRNTALRFDRPQDAACLTGTQQVFGIVGAATGNSLCANLLFEVNAVAQDNVTQSRITVTEGVGVRARTDEVPVYCP